MSQSGQLQVLFVDDDVAILRTLTAYFERRGHSTQQATSGEEGIRLWHATHPDVAVVDMAMPGVGGFDVLRELRSSGAMLIILTANGDIDSALTAIRLGAENFLTKPIEMEHLLHAVEKAAEKAKLMRENAELRSLLQPTLRRRAAKTLLVGVLVVAALGLGRWIGRAGVEIPIPASAVATDGFDD